MKEAFEVFFNEYFAEKCAEISTEKERRLIKEAAQRYEALNEFLTSVQRDAVEKHIEVLCELQEEFVKKAFFKGCRFAVSFFAISAPDASEG